MSFTWSSAARSVTSSTTREEKADKGAASLASSESNMSCGCKLTKTMTSFGTAGMSTATNPRT
ncbi:hypothetical protein D3C83_116190 [compost metagenome]